MPDGHEDIEPRFEELPEAPPTNEEESEIRMESRGFAQTSEELSRAASRAGQVIFLEQAGINLLSFESPSLTAGWARFGMDPFEVVTGPSGTQAEADSVLRELRKLQDQAQRILNLNGIGGGSNAPGARQYNLRRYLSVAFGLEVEVDKLPVTYELIARFGARPATVTSADTYAQLVADVPASAEMKNKIYDLCVNLGHESEDDFWGRLHKYIRLNYDLKSSTVVLSDYFFFLQHTKTLFPLQEQVFLTAEEKLGIVREIARRGLARMLVEISPPEQFLGSAGSESRTLIAECRQLAITSIIALLRGR